MTESTSRTPDETPEWTGGDPLDTWPARPEVGRRNHEPAAPADATGKPPAQSAAAEPVDADQAAEEDPEPELPPAPAEELEAEEQPVADAEVAEREAAEHAAGEIDVPDGYGLIEGYPSGHRRHVAVVVGRFNGEITNRLLASALEELDAAGVEREAVTVMPVPGAFELPLGAMALAKTRKFSCVVALGCVIRGDTPHFEYVAGEAASGLQLAAIETGVPVAFGVLTCDTVEQAEARVGKGAEAVRTALEMADVFGQVRARARA